MLQAINDRIKGWVGAVIVMIIGIPFAFWGIQSYLGEGGDTFAAKVNGIEISVNELENAYINQRRLLEQQFGANIPLSPEQIKQSVLDGLIDRILLQDMSSNSGFQISDKFLSNTIKENKQIQQARIIDEDGNLDAALYEKFIAENRRQTTQQYEAEYRNAMSVAQLRHGISSTAIVTENEITKFAILQEQSRDIDIITFKITDYLDSAKVTEKEVKNYYELFSSKYMTPEKLSIEYIELKGNMIDVDADIDEDRVQQMYDEYLEQITKTEKRKAKHILMTYDKATEGDRQRVQEQLLDIRKKILSGGSIDKFAREFSEDPGTAAEGGALDWAGLKENVKSFEDALFSLEKGELSGIVETKYGLHLIQLDDIKSDEVKPLSEKRAAYEAELKKELVGDIFYDKSVIMESAAYENDGSLDAVVDELGLEVKTSSLFTANAGEGIALNPDIRAQAFSAQVLEQGINSEVITLAPDHIVVLRIKEHIERSLKSIDDVYTSIEKNLQSTQVRSIVSDKADEVLKNINEGKSVKSLLTGNIKLEKQGYITRENKKKVNAQILNTAFEMGNVKTEGVTVEKVSQFNGDIALVILKDVKDNEISEEKLKLITARLNQERSYSEFEVTLSSLRDKAEVVRNNLKSDQIE